MNVRTFYFVQPNNEKISIKNPTTFYESLLSLIEANIQTKSSKIYSVEISIEAPNTYNIISNPIDMLRGESVDIKDIFILN